jgi:hypothetical protein
MVSVAPRSFFAPMRRMLGASLRSLPTYAASQVGLIPDLFREKPNGGIGRAPLLFRSHAPDVGGFAALSANLRGRLSPKRRGADQLFNRGEVPIESHAARRVRNRRAGARKE